MEHEVDTVPDKKQNEARPEIPVIQNMERHHFAFAHNEFIIAFKQALSQCYGNGIQKCKNQEKYDLLVDRPDEKIVRFDGRPHEMRQDNADLDKEKNTAKQDAFFVYLVENKGKKQVNKRANAPSNHLEYPIPR